jgi:diaminopimelate epimerase
MKANLPFWKLHSIGNDFPLVHLDAVEELRLAQAHDGSERSLDFLLAELAVRMADRRFGVGGDGLLAVGMRGEQLCLRMFNADGTEDFCGNGLRIAAYHAYEQGWVPPDHTILHGGREVPARVLDEGMVSTLIGAATYDPERVPHSGWSEIFNATVWSGMDAGMPLSLFGSALSTGSTHVIVPTTVLPDDDTFRSVSAKVEVDAKFPQRTSVIWSREAGERRLEIRIWERGVGETLGCGTGASAAAADHMRRKRIGGEIEVASAGGTIRVRAESWDAPLEVEGDVHPAYEGEYAVQA